jgi:hypothetical protein
MVRKHGLEGENEMNLFHVYFFGFSRRLMAGQTEGNGVRLPGIINDIMT